MKILHAISSPAASGAKMFLNQGHSMHIGFLGKASDTGRSIDFERAFLAELRGVGESTERAKLAVTKNRSPNSMTDENDLPVAFMPTCLLTRT